MRKTWVVRVAASPGAAASYWYSVTPDGVARVCRYESKQAAERILRELRVKPDDAFPRRVSEAKLRAWEQELRPRFDSPHARRVRANEEAVARAAAEYVRKKSRPRRVRVRVRLRTGASNGRHNADDR